MEAVFRGQLPDVMGWFGDLTYWYHAHEQIGDLPARWQGPDGLHEMHRELNVGEYIPGCDACTMAEADQVEHTVQTTGLQRIESWHTPMGSIRQVQEYSYDSYSWGYTEHAVKDVPMSGKLPETGPGICRLWIRSDALRWSAHANLGIEQALGGRHGFDVSSDG
jgi:hypothetical protein